MEEKFREYLKEFKKGNKEDKEISRCINTIKNIGEKYNLNIFDIPDKHEFEKKIKEISSDPEFQKLNSDGNRMYSTILEHYNKFLYYLDSIKQAKGKYIFVSARKGGEKGIDMTNEVIKTGIWKQYYGEESKSRNRVNKLIEDIKNVEVGSRIAIRSGAFTMKIKAIGTVISNDKDGSLGVKLKPLDPPKTVYGYNQLNANATFKEFNYSDADEKYKKLIEFTFHSLEDEFGEKTKNKEDENSEKNQNKEKESDEWNNKTICKNMILYGPPGTGKTYNSIIYAVAICSHKSIEELENLAKSEAGYKIIKEEYEKFYKKGQIAFTTFHQSYSYEDFIGGIKPFVDENNNMIYKPEDGIFKAFCDRADSNSLEDDAFEKNENSAEEIFEDAWEKLVDRIEKNNGQYTLNVGSRNKPYIFKLNNRQDGLKKSWSTGKTNHITSRRVYAEWQNLNSDYKSPNWFINNASTAVLNELKKYCQLPEFESLHEYKKTTVENKKNNYVFIIDEINRGNISKIFGELITLIEENKRKGKLEVAKVVLPYLADADNDDMNNEFSVPDNVYIIGTMNTADRSIALMDTALRRRFEFIEIPPAYDILNSITIDNVEVDLAKMLQTINNRIEILYDREHTIGQSFFMKINERENVSISELRDIFEKNIIPLLQEYFYDDYAKIKLILNNDFIIEDELNDKLFNQDILNKLDIDVESLNRKKYILNKNALDDVNNYIKIYSGVN